VLLPLLVLERALLLGQPQARRLEQLQALRLVSLLVQPQALLLVLQLVLRLVRWLVQPQARQQELLLEQQLVLLLEQQLVLLLEQPRVQLLVGVELTAVFLWRAILLKEMWSREEKL
jgi:hypothetical protein